MCKDLFHTGFLVDLNGSHITVQSNNLADELQITDTDQLVHSTTGHLVGNDDQNRDKPLIYMYYISLLGIIYTWTRHAMDIAQTGLSIFIAVAESRQLVHPFGQFIHLFYLISFNLYLCLYLSTSIFFLDLASVFFVYFKI